MGAVYRGQVFSASVQASQEAPSATVRSEAHVIPAVAVTVAWQIPRSHGPV